MFQFSSFTRFSFSLHRRATGHRNSFAGTRSSLNGGDTFVAPYYSPAFRSLSLIGIVSLCVFLWVMPAGAKTRRAKRTITKRSVSSTKKPTQRQPHLQKVAVARVPWLNHYLPVDRMRIKGRIWRYVSTDLDTYYHEPSSPLMLQQSPDNVIGFASAADAEDAGYLPEPLIQSQNTRLASAFSKQTWASLSASAQRTSATPVGVTRSGNSISIPWSQIPPDVRMIILVTDKICDAIEEASSDAELWAIKRELTEMRQGTMDGQSLAAVTGNAAAFADMNRWAPILQLLDAATDDRLNNAIPEVGQSIARDRLRLARESARMLIPGVKEAILGDFTGRVRQQGQNMLRRP